MDEKPGRMARLKAALLSKHFIRGALLTLVPMGVLAWLMSGHAELGEPNVARKLGHAAFGLWAGIGLLVVVAIGILDMMGAWDAAREEERCGGPAAPAPAGAAPDPWYVRWLWLFVLVVSSGLIMARIGSFGLWDPWEGHYGEVARRILEQDDWISLFWYDDWFFSKPVLDMWLMALGMGLLGINFWPDGPGASAPIPCEWGVRGPMGVIAIIGIMAAFHTVKRRWGWKAGLYAGLVLTATPFYFFLSHQSMTDMPFVAPLVVSLCLIMLGLYEDPQRRVRTLFLRLGARRVPVSGFHLLVLAFVLLALSQFVYYATRDMTFHWGTIGQENVRAETQAVRIPVALLGPVFGLVWAWVLFTLRAERRTQALYFMGGYLAAAYAFLGKGLGGIMLPGMIVLVHLTITGDWRKLKEVRLLRGALIVLSVGFPWYVAMHLRHGGAFLNRLLVHDHINRLAVGVHGDVGTFSYYTQQVIVGTFPWTGLIPAAILYRFWSSRRKEDPLAEDKSVVFLISWFMCAFLLFSMMVTKFHHYVFPAVPPLALLVGIFLKDLLDGKVRHAAPVVIGSFVLFCFSSIAVCFKPTAGTKGYERFIHLFIYNYQRSWPAGDTYDFSLILTVISVIAAALILLLVFARIRRWVILAYLVLGCFFAGWAMNWYLPVISPHWSEGYIIRAYYKHRTSPAQRLIVYKLNWKGENYYTGSRAVINETMDDDKFKKWILENRGQRHYFLTSMGMEGSVERFLNTTIAEGHKVQTIVPPEHQSNKFTVVVADLK